MNETINTILKRRSIRKFKQDQIKDSDLEQILNAAIHAPSARNQQKWHFTVVQNNDMISRMVEITKANIAGSDNAVFKERIASPDYHTYFHAPTVIVVSGEEDYKHVKLDCGLAAQNILLAAESMGINSVVMTSTEFLFASKDPSGIKKELGIPEGYSHICMIALGYAEGNIPPVPRRNKEVVTYIK